MKNIVEFLQAVYDNLPMILTIIAILSGIFFRVRRFVRLTKEEQKAALQQSADKIVELVKKQLLSIVTQAEKEWGGGTGKIKKSWVWAQITAQFGKLAEYISDGLIDKEVVDALIEEAVSEMEHLRETNNKVAAVVEDTATP